MLVVVEACIEARFSKLDHTASSLELPCPPAGRDTSIVTHNRHRVLIAEIFS
jgi:hypothetical protein